MPNRTSPIALFASLLAVQLVACGSNSATKQTTGGNDVNQTDGSTDGNTNTNTNTDTTTSSSVKITAIAIDPVEAFVPAGAPVRFTAVATLSDGSTKDVTASATWASADTTCATARAAANEFDTQTACANSAAFDVTATDPETGVSGTAALTVVQQQVSTFDLVFDEQNPTILVGTTLKLTVAAYFEDGSPATVTFLDWSSSNVNVAPVDPDGTVHGLLVSATPAAITVTATGSTVSATTSVYVTDVPHALSYVQLSPGSVRSDSGRIVTGSIYLTSPALDPKVVTLTSSDASVTIDPATVTIAPGEISGTFQVTTTPIAKRTKVTITATSDDGAKTATLNDRAARK